MVKTWCGVWFNFIACLKIFFTAVVCAEVCDEQDFAPFRACGMLQDQENV